MLLKYSLASAIVEVPRPGPSRLKLSWKSSARKAFVVLQVPTTSIVVFFLPLLVLLARSGLSCSCRDGKHLRQKSRECRRGGGAPTVPLAPLVPLAPFHSFHSRHSLHSPYTLPVIPFVYRASGEWREWFEWLEWHGWREWREWREWRKWRKWREWREWRKWRKWREWRGRLHSSVRCLCGRVKDLSLRFRFYGSTVGA